MAHMMLSILNRIIYFDRLIIRKDMRNKIDQKTIVNQTKRVYTFKYILSKIFINFSYILHVSMYISYELYVVSEYIWLSELIIKERKK